MLARLIPTQKAFEQSSEPARGNRPVTEKLSEPGSDFWSGFERQAQNSSSDSKASRLNEGQPLGILVPVDLTDASLSALDCAFRIGREEKARVTLLHAIHLNLSPFGPVNVDLIKREMRHKASATMSRITGLARREGICADYLVREGKPSAVIEKFLQTENVDLVVMACHRHHGLSRWLRRRTALKVIRGAQCPVVVLQTNHADEEMAL